MKTKPWRCGSGQHVIGLVVWNGNGVAQLGLIPMSPHSPPVTVLRQAQDGDIPLFAEYENGGMEGLTLILGRAKVPCPICKTIRVWDATPEALVEIFRHLDAGQVFEFSRKLLGES